jgi:uncharacterized membrane protein
MRNNMGERYCALAIGILFLLLGLVGFIPAFISVQHGGVEYIPPTSVPDLYSVGYGYLFGLFPTNLVHNIVHALVGFMGIAAFFDARGSRVYCRVFAYAYALLALLGLIPFARTLFGLMPIFGNNVWFNALAAVIAAYFGFAKPIKEMNNTVSTSS